MYRSTHVSVFVFIFPLVNKDRRKKKDLVKAKERFGRQKEEVSPLSYRLFLLYDSSFNRMTLVHMSIFILSRCLFPVC